ncbi:MAG TPA: hypothetical protein VFH34_11570, partial [Anaerolineales bacterium]|nr:hypothetical protein [Anaerolineales bacterium]
MNTKVLLTFLLGLTLLAACASPATQPPPTPTFIAFPTSTLLIGTPPTAALLTPGASTPLPGVTVTGVAPTNPSTICGDPQVTTLIDSFKT